MPILQPRSVAIFLGLAILLGPFSGCSPRAKDKTTATNEETNSETLTAAPPDSDHQQCFACNGRGVARCSAAGCVSGQMECPNPCLKLSRGKWEHMNVPGHSPNELWQKFRDGDGTTAWSQAHVGEVVEVRSGKAVNLGRCPRCSGTTKIQCATCGGKGEGVCELCEGKKLVPIAWSLTNNPVLNRQPDLIRLKDGRVLLGRVAMRSGTKYSIKTRDGTLVNVEAAEIVPRTVVKTNAPAL